MGTSESGDATEIHDTEISELTRSPVHVSVRAGALLQGHRVDRRIGAGGMGEVYAATRLRDRTPLALKLLGRAHATHLYRFKREFRALADAEHRNLVRLHELVVPPDGPAFFTMELVDGVPFTEHVRGGAAPGELPDLGRLRDALRQLVVGVHELHGRGCVHRDLKPSNVLVDRSGRVVILDFGLVSELDSLDEGVTHDGQLLGTPAYMAPEQAMGGGAGPAADYYAVGVMLFESLTGNKPFTGSAMAVMLAKQDGQLPDPGALAEAPPELRSLCTKLLAPDPERRPTGRELLASLGDTSPTSSSLASAEDGLGSRRLPFVGRDDELERLHAALREVHETRASVTVLLRGPSGCGKSALIRRFLSRLRARERALIFSGRCLERESVPYKGVDALIDALSVHLRRLPAPEVAALLPRHVAALIKLFPVLADVWKHHAGLAPAHDPGEQRRLALAAIRELLTRLCERRPLVLCVDDFQWGDVDSVRLLSTLTRPPDAPNFLLILSFLDEAEPSAAVRELAEPSTLEGRELRALELGPLADADALALALALLGEHPDIERARALARQSAGNPLFLTQLALASPSPASLAAGELDEVVARSVAGLSPAARRLLAMVAIAGGPIPRAAAFEAFSIETVGGSDSTLLDELIERRLLVAARPRADDRSLMSQLDPQERVLELAHSRVRAAALAPFEAEELAGLHLRLASALERLGADAETLGDHFARAGDRERSALYVERAAEQASEALAFARAADLYRRALELLPEGDEPRRRELRARLAEQLVADGHTSAAADALLELAAELEPAQAADLRRRALNQLARCGRVDEAIAIARELLDALDEPMPRGHWSAALMFIREHLRLTIRGHGFEPRSASEIPAAELERLDTLMAIANGLAIHEIMLTLALGIRATRLAYDAGDPHRLGVLVNYGSVIYAALGRFEDASEQIVESREIAALANNLEVFRANDLCEAMVEGFMLRTSKAKQLFGRLIERCADAPNADWIRGFAIARYAQVCLVCGELAEFRREYPGWIAHARERGNVHEFAVLEAYAAMVSVYYDELEQAQRHLDSACAVWKASRYTFTDVTIDFATSALLVRTRRLDEANAHIREVFQRLRRSGLHRLRSISELARSIHARILVTSLLEAPARRELYRRARRAARPRRRTREPLRLGEALIWQAALLSLSGDHDGARMRWRKALQHCERHDMRAHLAALHLRLAELTHGHEARELEGLGLAYLAEQGIGNREAFVDTFAPAQRQGR